MTIKDENMQLSKFSSPVLDIIVLYRSQRGSYSDLQKYIEMMDSQARPLLVIGDFNFCYLTTETNQAKKFFSSKQFTQIIKEPTHIEGHLLDHAYVRDVDENLKWTAKVHSKYYTDHK